jgi:apolipoprotein N-acyltransferase
MDELPSIEMVPSTQPTLIASPPPAQTVLAIVLPILAVAFSAFCVWLVVRIVNRRDRWAKWTLAATVGLPVVYLLSTGPVIWLWRRDLLPYSVIDVLYEPFMNAPDPIYEAVKWYVALWE